CRLSIPELGLASGPRIWVPFLSNTRISGVNGLVGEVTPPTRGLSSLLQMLGKPCPDSSTKTSKLPLLPRKATAVGKLRFLAKTDPRYPDGTTMSSPLPGL